MLSTQPLVRAGDVGGTRGGGVVEDVCDGEIVECQAAAAAAVDAAADSLAVVAFAVAGRLSERAEGRVEGDRGLAQGDGSASEVDAAAVTVARRGTDPVCHKAAA